MIPSWYHFSNLLPATERVKTLIALVIPLVMLLLGSTALSLILGWFFSFIGNVRASHLVLALGGISGLYPSIKWLIASVREKQYGSDLLALLTIVATLASGEYLASAVIALMLATGRILEKWATGKADRELQELLSRVPHETHQLNEDGSLTDMSVSEITVAMKIVVKSGEVIPADGTLLTKATIDQAALTGEPLPVEREVSESISSGTLNAGQNFSMLVEKLPINSTYAGIIELVQSAKKNYSQSIRLANRYAILFIPAVIGVAVITLLVTRSFARAVAILVIATPCPLILAVPIAVVSGMSMAAKRGVIVRSGAALEKLAEVQTLLIDKTGTLTVGGPEVTNVYFTTGYTKESVLRFAASLDQHSPHVVAKAIVAAALKSGVNLELASNPIEDHGVGITGEVANSLVYVGKIRSALPPWVPVQVGLYVGVEVDSQLIGVIQCSDPIRLDAKSCLDQLISEGITRIVLVTGDSEAGSKEIMSKLPISEPHYALTPAGKLAIVKEEMKRTKGSVVLIGDGINDSPALAAADVGIAMGGSAATAASEAADVVIVEPSLTRVVAVVKIAKLTVRRAIQAAVLGMSLSTIGMVFAANGTIKASAGAFLQEGIDLLSILWALTILVAYRDKRFDQSTLSRR